MERRHFIGLSVGAVGGLILWRAGVFTSSAAPPAGHHLRSSATKETYPVQKTDAEWREQLSPQAYKVLRREGTEAPGSSELNAVKTAGEFRCAGCGQALFASDRKYESGTGWPSFYDYIDGALAFKTDYKMLLPRKEYHCSRCGGHQGHVFKDGPEPTGLRYCNNGVALSFVAADESSA